MAFPIPGDVFEQRLDLNQHLIKRPAATFMMRVADDMAANHDVQPGDLLVCDRSLNPTPGALVVAIQDGALTVTKLPDTAHSIEVWGVVTSLVRQFPGGR